MKSNKTRITGSLAIAMFLFLATAAVSMAQAGGATSPSLAVEALVGSFGSGQVTSPECNALGGSVVECPISDRLRGRLASPQAGEKGNLISRSDVVPTKVELTLVNLVPDATVAEIPTRWEYSASAGAVARFITFTVRKNVGGWQVDDIYCLNNPASSIYNGPVSPCPEATSPGMPSTGGEIGSLYPAILLTGLISLLVGALLIGRARQEIGKRCGV